MLSLQQAWEPVAVFLPVHPVLCPLHSEALQSNLSLNGGKQNHSEQIMVWEGV